MIGQASYNSNDPEEFVNFVNRNLYPIVYLSFFSFTIEDIEDHPVHIVEEMPLTAIEMITPVGPVVISPVQFGRIPDMMGPVPRLVRGTQIPSPPSPPRLVLGPQMIEQGNPPLRSTPTRVIEDTSTVQAHPQPTRAPTMFEQINNRPALRNVAARVVEDTSTIQAHPQPTRAPTMLEQINNRPTLRNVGNRVVEDTSTVQPTRAPTMLEQINNRPALRNVAARVIEDTPTRTQSSVDGMLTRSAMVTDFAQGMANQRARVNGNENEEIVEEEIEDVAAWD